MPLKHSTSDKARSENIAEEIKSGKDRDQAAAIGYSIQREAKKKGAKMGEDMKMKKGGKKKPMHGHHEGKNEFKQVEKHMPKLGEVACGVKKPEMKMKKKMEKK